MIRKTIDIEPYQWRVYAYLASEAKDADEILERVESIGISAAQYMRAERHIQKALRDSGMTYSSLSSRESVVVVSVSSSEEEAFNTFSHELRHLTDDIAEACDIPLHGEEVAYLTGSIALALASELLYIVCDCPVCSTR